MADLLAPERAHAVLEVGTGLGYQAAILAELVDRVWSVEVVEELATEAASRLRELGYTNVTLRIGDGSRGWAEHAPYDRILVTAAAEAPPAALIGQLRPGGRMVMPIGPPDGQQLTVVDKTASGEVRARPVLPVRFTLLETVI
jgi:protein-L-isoaspartate(D-aspartate) O-methyltransferase